jgi:hypothetical protein
MEQPQFTVGQNVTISIGGNYWQDVVREVLPNTKQITIRLTSGWYFTAPGVAWQHEYMPWFIVLPTPSMHPPGSQYTEPKACPRCGSDFLVTPGVSRECVNHDCRTKLLDP